MKTTVYIKMGTCTLTEAIEFVLQSGHVVATGWTRVNGMYAIDIADTVEYEDAIIPDDYETWQFSQHPGAYRIW